MSQIDHIRSGVEAAFETERRFLWGLSYRMTGNGADADEIVQETFVRALQTPPSDVSREWRPWLAKVALNLSRDVLRRRRRQSYVGPWLPSPIETDPLSDPPAHEMVLDGRSSADARYDLLESVSFAFLLALEALPPRLRAVLLLRDVFDYSTEQVADTLDMTPGNVKTNLHRARAAMAAYDKRRCVPTNEHRHRVETAVLRLFEAVASGDVDEVARQFSPDAVALSDGGGEFFAAKVPIVGAAQLAKFHLNIFAMRPALKETEIRSVNGVPGLLVEFSHGRERYPRRIVSIFDLAPDGRIARVYSVMATPKLGAITFKG